MWMAYRNVGSPEAEPSVTTTALFRSRFAEAIGCAGGVESSHGDAGTTALYRYGPETRALPASVPSRCGDSPRMFQKITPGSPGVYLRVSLIWARIPAVS